MTRWKRFLTTPRTRFWISLPWQIIQNSPLWDFWFKFKKLSYCRLLDFRNWDTFQPLLQRRTRWIKIRIFTNISLCLDMTGEIYFWKFSWFEIFLRRRKVIFISSFLLRLLNASLFWIQIEDIRFVALVWEQRGILRVRS